MANYQITPSSGSVGETPGKLQTALKSDAHNPGWKTMVKMLRAIELMMQPHGTNTQELRAELGLTNPRDFQRTVLPALESLGLIITHLDMDKAGVTHRYKIDRANARSVQIGIPGAKTSLLDPLLSPEEWMLLAFLLNSGARLTQRPEIQAVVESLRTKLGTVLSDATLKDDQQKIAGLFSRLEPVFEHLDNKQTMYTDETWEMAITPLTQALADQRVCEVHYEPQTTGTMRIWRIWPLRMIEHGGSLYVVCYNEKYANKPLTLEVGRFKRVNVCEEQFVYPEIDLDARLDTAFGVYLDDVRHFRIRFRSEVSRLIASKRWGNNQTLEREADGSTILDFESSGYEEVKRWVMTWGSDALVLEPAELAKDIVKALTETLNRYMQITEPPAKVNEQGKMRGASDQSNF